MKIVYFEDENLHIFWTTWGIEMNFSGNMWLMRILKIAKKQGFILSLKYTFLEKSQGLKLTPTAFLSLAASGR